MSKILTKEIAKAFDRLDENGVDLAGGSNVRPRSHMTIRDGEEISEWKLAVRSADPKRCLGTAFVTGEVLASEGWAAASEIRNMSAARISMVMAVARMILRLEQITTVEQFNTLTSMIAFGRSTGYLR